MTAPQSPQRPDAEAIEARAMAATPGPWNWAGTDLNGGRQIEAAIEFREFNPVLVPYVCDSCDKGGPRLCLGPNEPDSAFIVAARTDIPSLLAWIRHLEAEAVELKDVIKVRDHEAREEIRRIRAGEID